MRIYLFIAYSVLISIFVLAVSTSLTLTAGAENQRDQTRLISPLMFCSAVTLPA